MKPFHMVAAICTSLFLYTHLVLAVPVIGIGSMYDVMISGTQSMTKRIYNTGDSTAFVRVEIIEIHPGDGEAKELPQKEVTDNKLEKNRLIVTPLRLIVPPAGFQAVRILWAGDRDVEKYYRVRFTPVMPEENDSFGLDANAVKEYRKESLEAGVNILTGYGTIVIVQPDKPAFNSVIDSANPDFISVKNKGNATLSLDNIRHCKPGNTDCGSSSREFILPGRSKDIEKKPGFKTNFTLIEGSEKRILTF